MASSLLDVEIERIWTEWKGPECPGEQGYLGQRGQTQREAGSCGRQEQVQDLQIQVQIVQQEHGQVLLRRLQEQVLVLCL